MTFFNTPLQLNPSCSTKLSSKICSKRSKSGILDTLMQVYCHTPILT